MSVSAKTVTAPATTEKPIMPRRVIRWARSAQTRPRTTTRSQRETCRYLLVRRAARRRATFSEGVSAGRRGFGGCAGFGRDGDVCGARARELGGAAAEEGWGIEVMAARREVGLV